MRVRASFSRGSAARPEPFTVHERGGRNGTPVCRRDCGRGRWAHDACGRAGCHGGEHRPGGQAEETEGEGDPGAARPAWIPRAAGVRWASGPLRAAGTAGPGRSAGRGRRRRGRPGPPGPSAIRIGFDVPAGTAETELVSAGGLILKGACSAGGDLSLEASSTANNARARALVVAAGTPTDSVAYDEDDDLDTIDGFDFVGAADDDAVATLLYRSAAGGVVTANLILEQYSVGGAARCLVAGSAVVAS